MNLIDISGPYDSTSQLSLYSHLNSFVYSLCAFLYLYSYNTSSSCFCFSQEPRLAHSLSMASINQLGAFFKDCMNQV